MLGMELELVHAGRHMLSYLNSPKSKVFTCGEFFLKLTNGINY
jgi:hypothetical protein